MFNSNETLKYPQNANQSNLVYVSGGIQFQVHKLKHINTHIHIHTYYIQTSCTGMHPWRYPNSNFDPLSLLLTLPPHLVFYISLSFFFENNNSLDHHSRCSLFFPSSPVIQSVVHLLDVQLVMFVSHTQYLL